MPQTMSRKSLQRIAAIAIGITWPFRKKNRLLLVGVIAALSAACGDDGPKMPTAPTVVQPPSATEPPIRISSQGSVRVMYVAPADREFRADYSAGIARAIVDVQSWYRNQLDGLTFSIYSVVPEWCQLPREHDYYSHGDAWEKVLRDVQSCAPVRGDTSRFSWALYVDVYEACGEPHELGRGGAGLTMVARWDLEGLVNPGKYYYCDEGPYDGAAWSLVRRTCP